MVLLLLLVFHSREYVCQDTATYPDLFSGGNNQRYLILLIFRDGLANRLRSIADWYSIAQASGRELVVSWAPRIECNAMFSDLFDIKATKRNLPHFRPLSYSILDSGDSSLEAEVRDIATEHGLTFAMLPLIEDFFIPFDSAVFSDHVNAVMTTYHGLVAMEGIPCTQYLSGRSNFLSSLAPIKYIADYLQNLQYSHFGANHLMVGVHYRVHREEFDWAVVPPLLDTDTSLKFSEGASLEDFKTTMTELLTAKPHIRFFFASNDVDAKEDILNIFQDKVVILRGSDSRSSVEGIQFALLEWLTLSRAQLVLHTYGSSFGQEAAQVHGAALVGIWHQYKVYSRNGLLNYCGIPNFMKKYTNFGVSKAYMEGTVDRRVIDDQYFRIKSCTSMDQWGMSEVYCSERASEGDV